MDFFEYPCNKDPQLRGCEIAYIRANNQWHR